MKNYLERLNELRKSKQISQKELANILGTTNSSICDWECGRAQRDLKTLINVAKYFEVTTDYLLGLCE